MLKGTEEHRMLLTSSVNSMVLFNVKATSAASSLKPRAAAHHDRPVPHPSQVPQLDVGSMTVLWPSAEVSWQRCKARQRPTRVRLTMVTKLTKLRC